MELPPRLQSVPAVWGNKVTWAFEADGTLKDGFPLEGILFFTQSYKSREEYMDSLGGKDWNQFKPCSHFLSGCTILNGFSSKRYFLDPSTGDWGYVVYKNAKGDLWPQQLGELDLPLGVNAYAIPSLFVLVNGFKQVAQPKNFDYLRERSLRTLLPGIKPSLSLVNAVIELKDFKRVFERGAQLTSARTVRELYQRMKSFYRPKKGDKRTIRRYLRASADAYLQAQFNILPLLKDVKALAEALQSTRKQVQNLLDRERAEQVRHFECPLDTTVYYDRVDTVTAIPTDAAHATLDGSPNFSREVKYNRAVFNATIRYSYALNDWERRNAELGGILDSLGVNLNPAIIWNAIPWTFVIDWVLGVSNFLDQTKSRWLEPVCTIHDYCSSVTVDREITCSMNLNDLGLRSEGWSVASRIHEKSYKRDIMLPDFMSAIRASGLNPVEFSLGAALLASR